MLLSAVWTLILTAPIQCRGSIGEQLMQCYISPNLFWWRKKLIYILNGLMMNKYLANFHFWVSSSVQFNTSYNLPETHSSDFNEQRNSKRSKSLLKALCANPKPSFQDIFSMAFCGIWNVSSRSQRDLQTSVIIFQSRSSKRSLIRTRLLNPAGRLLSLETWGAELRLPRFPPVCGILPLRPFGCLCKFSNVERVQRDQALFCFYQ